MSCLSRPVGRTALLVLLAGGAAILLVPRLRSSPAEAAFKRGEQLEAIKMDPDAKSAYEEAIRKDPRYAPPYRSLALLADKHGAPDVSADFWRQYIARRKTQDHAHCFLAQVELNAGQEVEALRDAELEMKSDPKCPRANLLAGMLYTRKSQSKRALDHLGVAAQAYPDDLETQLTFGRVLALTGDYRRAEEQLRPILTKDKSHAQPYYWLAYVAMRKPSTPDTLREAEDNLNQALDLQPDYYEANLEMGRLRMRQKRHAGAFSFAKRASELNAHDPGSYLLLAQAADACGKPAEAAASRAKFKIERDLASEEKSLLKTYGLDTKNVDVAIRLAKAATARGKAESALAILRMTAQQVGENAQLAAAIVEAEAAVGPAKSVAPTR